MNLLPLFQAHDSYDAADTDDRPRGGNAYLSRKDLKWVVLAIGITFAAAIPLYLFYKENSDRTLCKRNMLAIGTAMLAYADFNDNRLPLAYEPDPQTGGPWVKDGVLQATWVGAITPYMNTRASFLCPRCGKDEATVHQHPQSSSKTIECSYGFYAPLAAVPITSLSNPEATIMVTESSNGGYRGSYNPVPYQTDNSPRMDGFSLGFDDINDWPTQQSRFVTRLAFYETADGKFDALGPTRHRDGLNGVTVAGGGWNLMPDSARIERPTPGSRRIVGLWAIPALRPLE
jgi:predicted RNA-binding Zn-ribbon protein involved in translation (DUF1610 family)